MHSSTDIQLGESFSLSLCQASHASFFTPNFITFTLFPGNLRGKNLLNNRNSNVSRHFKPLAAIFSLTISTAKFLFCSPLYGRKSKGKLIYRSRPDAGLVKLQRQSIMHLVRVAFPLSKRGKTNNFSFEFIF